MLTSLRIAKAENNANQGSACDVMWISDPIHEEHGMDGHGTVV
ncbi:MAG: hypothetical protein ABSF28_01245 [Terracidiphilus sp.]|jgi:hypothetical protein